MRLVPQLLKNRIGIFRKKSNPILSQNKEEKGEDLGYFDTVIVKAAGNAQRLIRFVVFAFADNKLNAGMTSGAGCVLIGGVKRELACMVARRI
jgi:hypothetical protein